MFVNLLRMFSEDNYFLPYSGGAVSLIFPSEMDCREKRNFLQRKADGNMGKKWSGSAVSPVTETREKVVIPLAEIRVCRCVSSTESYVSVTFQFTDC